MFSEYFNRFYHFLKLIFGKSSVIYHITASISSHSFTEDYDKQTWEERQKARHIRLAKVCQQNKGGTRSIVDPDRFSSFLSYTDNVPLIIFHSCCRFLYEPRSNILWCDVAKAGSTTYVRWCFTKSFLSLTALQKISPGQYSSR